MLAGNRTPGGSVSEHRTVQRSPRASRRDARAGVPSTSTALSATSRAAWVRDRPSWSARNRSRRSVASAQTVKLSSGSRGGLRFGAAGILPPEGDRERDRAAADGDVGDVEGGPAERADPDVEKVHDAASASDPVDEIARRAAGDQPE